MPAARARTRLSLKRDETIRDVFFFQRRILVPDAAKYKKSCSTGQRLSSNTSILEADDQQTVKWSSKNCFHAIALPVENLKFLRSSRARRHDQGDFVVSNGQRTVLPPGWQISAAKGTTRTSTKTHAKLYV